MDVERTLLEALRADPDDLAGWLALSDWLEEAGQGRRADLLRLRLRLQDPEAPRRDDSERRLRELLDEGAAPVFVGLTNSAGMELALVPAGTFWMGSPKSEPGRHTDEDPRHKVALSRAFYLGVCPVTQAQYERVAGHNPSHFRAGGQGAALVAGLDTSDFPVENVSWHDAVAFCARLSALPQEKEAGRVYRLPTEAEWEYCCRAGTTTEYHFGSSLGRDKANFDGGARLSPGRTCPVRSSRPNAWGLYDVHGNVWEWCSDWFAASYYQKSPATDPKGPTRGSRRALRGGGWYWAATICRSAYRYRAEPDVRNPEFGLRVAMDASEG